MEEYSTLWMYETFDKNQKCEQGRVMVGLEALMAVIPT